MTFRCVKCGAEISIRYLKSGEVAQCKICGTPNVVPETDGQIQFGQVVRKDDVERGSSMSRVGIAVTLLAASLVVWVVSTFIMMSQYRASHMYSDEGINWPIMGYVVLVTAIASFMLVMIAKRKNWARIVTLVFLAICFVWWAIAFIAILFSSPLEGFPLSAVEKAFQVSAAILLLTREGADSFRHGHSQG